MEAATAELVARRGLLVDLAVFYSGLSDQVALLGKMCNNIGVPDLFPPITSLLGGTLGW